MKSSDQLRSEQPPRRGAKHRPRHVEGEQAGGGGHGDDGGPAAARIRRHWRQSTELRWLVVAGVWLVVLLGLSRVPQIEALLIRLARFEGGLAAQFLGTRLDSVVINASCTGADAAALALAAVLAFPTRWRRRLLGAAGALAVLTVLNATRVATLAAVAERSELFELLHVYVWPAVLVVAAAGSVAVWMAMVTRGGILRSQSAPALALEPSRGLGHRRRGSAGDLGDLSRARGDALAGAGVEGAAGGTAEARAGEPRVEDLGATLSGTRAAWAAAALVAGVAAHYALFPWLSARDEVTAACHAVAAASATILGWLGGEASSSDAFLTVEGRRWIVTPECILTPILPVYLVLVGFLIRRPRWRALAWLATVPLFFGLGVVRALVLGAPAAFIGDPAVAVHAFFQVVAAGAAVALAWYLFGSRKTADLVWGMLAGLVVAWVAGVVQGALPALPISGHWGHGHADTQGALLLLAPFQLGLAVALATVLRLRGRVPLLAAAGVLVTLHLALRLSYGELVEHLGLALPVATVRALALLAPLAAVATARGLLPPEAAGVSAGRFRRGESGREEVLSGDAKSAAGYRHFWNRVGDEFPDLSGAPTTRIYRQDEIALLGAAFPQLAGKRLLKTDLWDEARNTKILCWAAAQGVRAYGVDISLPTVLKARGEFRRRDLILGAVVADVRQLPFRREAFDGVYSMGTIEHFDETEQAAAEIGRVTGAGGRAVVGVPNRHDPFLRPLLVALLHRFGLYGYGDEKSYSRRQLGELCRRAGLRVVAHGGVLFLPGALRMADLTLWAWARPLARLTGLAAAPFAWLVRRFPALRRHGYLIAVIGEPVAPGHPQGGH